MHFFPGHTFLTPNLISDRKNPSSHNHGNGIRGPFSIELCLFAKMPWKLRKKPSEWIQGMSWIHTTQSRFEGRKAEENQFPLHLPISHHHFQKKSILYIRNPKKFLNLTDFFLGVGKPVGEEKHPSFSPKKPQSPPKGPVNLTAWAFQKLPIENGFVGKMSWQGASGDYVGFTGKIIVTIFRLFPNMGRKPIIFVFF